ncbi:MAG: chromosome segregation protein SMC [Acidobacteria bacterium]|nr:chromosome segregation protein SMC [Acidobacteriota bacterium]
MLKLKKLQILGFKSFCDRTELKFHGDGVAAIIGPNGCGKSNIADAISWVLGEQSAKTLRGSRMEDVIFSGTRDRKPTSMAEVSLTLIDPVVYDGPDKNDPTELDVEDEMPADDWDEAEIRTRAAEEAERMTEEAQPGRSEEVEVPRSKVTANSVAFPDDEPIFAARLADREGRAAEASAAGDRHSSASAASPHVVLKIRRRKFNQQQFRAGEIVVTRRLFRSGDSEYLLNGKLCRLRDIQELFMGTGLGPESYALIEQGRIGQILSSRPTDRRAIIEEAAGITKFKTRKRLAEARLEDAKQNLARVNDIFDEVTRQMNSLKRQASKAERYAKLRDEMRARLRVVISSKFAQFDHQSAELEAGIRSISGEIDGQAERVRQMEAELAASTQRGYAIEAEIHENSSRLGEIKLEVDRNQAQRRHNAERSRELEARSQASETELDEARLRLAALERELSSNRQILDSAAADLRGAQQELEASEQQADSAESSLAELELRQERSRGEILECVGSLSNLRNQLTQAEERMAAADREARRLEGELEAARAQAEAFGGERGQLALEFESVSQRLAALGEEIREARDLLAVKKRQESEGKDRLDRLRAEYASSAGKKSSLEALIAEHGYSTESVRRLFQSGALQGGRAPAGVLADFLEVEPQYESVVEDFLRDELNYIVVKSWDAADEGLRLLRTDVDGRATFLVHPEDSQAQFSFAVSPDPPSPSADSLVPLKQAIRVLDGFGNSLEAILPKLRDGYIVPDPQFARALALENRDAFFLSETGECFHNLTVTGGRQRAEGPLSMKRELRDIVRALAQLEQALGGEETRVLNLAREIDELSSLIERREGEKREAERQAMTSDHALRQLDSEMARVRERREVSERELARLARERKTHEEALEARTTDMAALENRRTELEKLSSSLQDELGSLRERRHSTAVTVSQKQARVAALSERHRSASSALERIEQLVGEIGGRMAAIRSQSERAAEERSQREIENLELSSKLVDLESERNAWEARAALLQAESVDVRTRVAEIDRGLRELRLGLDSLRDRKAQLSTEAVKLASDAEHLAETCLNDLGVGRAELMADPTLARAAGEELRSEERACQEARARLDAMGPVNMMALEEYRETAERQAFLETQRKDLVESIENTQATIKEIDTFSRQKFEEAFNRINENFQVTFKKLFGGGHALMRLTDEENSAESGIDVVASPPGKRLQNVLLLSGGEKAMTALALLVGIFQYQPSPFCILDEVDAPLDESNIGRFTELVQEMSVATQFVLITHSKKTMSVAPVLYGVTMQEPGVSKLVSVRFQASA